MSIQVIGAGMGRTGTMSLKAALEELGYKKCHHMFEVLSNPPQLPLWNDFYSTRSADFEQIFKGYQAVVDFPGAFFYKELMQQYPDAKVILTVRDPEKWYKSAMDTIYQLPKGFDKFMMNLVGLFKPEVRHVSKTLDFANRLVWLGLFQNKFSDKDFAIRLYNEWNEEVKRNVPPEKLLIYNVQEGWGPLCAFLEKPVPGIEFPRLNDTAAFKNRKKSMTK
jgi:hypothetical protein